jgi:anti-sigma B factor antagonist
VSDRVIEREESKATVHAPGDIVASSAGQLRGTLRELVGSGVRELVIDLSEVRMVDSTGLGLLVSTFNSMQKVGGKFSVIHASDELLRFFQAMRLPQHFAVSPTR